MSSTLPSPTTSPVFEMSNGHSHNNVIVHRSALSQAAFHEAIRQERRRSERSGRPFVLMLARLHHHAPNTDRIRALRTLIKTVRETVRETDTIGWHEEHDVLGVIFTEIGDV